MLLILSIVLLPMPIFIITTNLIMKKDVFEINKMINDIFKDFEEI
jgi:hypothetical protein